MMGARPSLVPPLITFSSGASPLLRLPTLFGVAAGAGLDGMDLDLSSRPLPRPGEVVALAAHYGMPVRAIWVPRPGFWTAWRPGPGTALATGLARACGAGTLVVDLPKESDGRISRASVTGVTESLRSSTSPPTRIAVAVRARTLIGGRGHLVQMTALRRLSEEWDFGIALDLTGQVDPRWEAEAAVSRLGSRLILMRLGSDAAVGPAFGRHRPAARALAAAIDAGHPAEFAIVPRVPAWQTAWPPALMRGCARAGGRLLERFSAVEEQRILGTHPHPKPGFRA